MKHKRFLLFAWDCYYPNGGLYDVRATFDTLEEMLEFARSDKHALHCDEIQLYDRETGDVIECEEPTAMRRANRIFTTNN